MSIVNDPKWAPDAVREILAFPAEPDDFVDMAGLVGRRMVQMSGIEPEVKPEPKPIQGLIVEKDGLPHLRLGLDTLFEDRERELATWRKQVIQIG